MMVSRCEGVKGSVSRAEEDDPDSNRVSKLYILRLHETMSPGPLSAEARFFGIKVQISNFT